MSYCPINKDKVDKEISKLGDKRPHTSKKASGSYSPATTIFTTKRRLQCQVGGVGMSKYVLSFKLRASDSNWMIIYATHLND